MKPLSYIEARKLIEKTKTRTSIDVTLCVSGTAEPLLPFIQGEIAKYGFSSKINFLPYGVLLQHLNGNVANDDNNEVWLIFPWDLIPTTDWRIGGGTLEVSLDSHIELATIQIDKICSRRPRNLVFVDAPIPPIGMDASNSEILRKFIKFYLSRVGAKIISGDVFSLQKYLITGFPFEGAALGLVAQNLMEHLANKDEPKKVLITDLDNTFWRGVAAEDGPSGIEMEPKGDGFKHYIYQNYLSQLQNLGVVIAAVTRNSDFIINEIFENSNPIFKKDQFAVIIASYEPKSAQIQEISDVMNLGLNSFVFVDDNVIEIHEVSSALPEVKSVHFSNNMEDFPSFINTLSSLFSRKDITKEDKDRTNKYKLMLSTLKSRKSASSDLSGFLRSLQMKLKIQNKTKNDCQRAIQLINKTNQFNANGVRISEEDFKLIIQGGGSVYTASHFDSSGDHGEILTLLVDSNKTVYSFVMSCRVFQRNIEHAFLNWFLSMPGHEGVKIKIKKTNKNEPFFNFLTELDIVLLNENEVLLNTCDVQKKLEKSLGLIEVIYESK